MRTSSVLYAALAATLSFSTALPAQGTPDRREEQRREEERRREERRREAERERAEERREREREREEERREREEERRERERDRAERQRAERTRIDTTVALARRGEVNLSLVAGDIVVRGWDRAQARVQAQSDGALRLESSPSRLSLREDGHRGRSDDTHVEVTVPYGTRLVLRSSSGEITATDVRGEVEARTMSGDVRIDGTTGRTLLESLSGEIEARNLNGPVRGNTTSGDIQLGQVTGDIELETVSGELTVNQARSSFVRLESTSGDLDFSGPLDRAGRYEFNSHSGTITLALPPEVGAQVSIETFSGDLDTAFPLTLAPNTSGARPRRFEFTLGGGGARVTAESFSGDINLLRAGRAGTSTTTPRD